MGLDVGVKYLSLLSLFNVFTAYAKICNMRFLSRPGFGSVAFRNSISAFNALSIRGKVSFF